MFNVNISVGDSLVNAELVIDSYFFKESSYDYAFHLIEIIDENRKNKVGSKRYSNNKKVVFSVKEMSGIFYVQCFIRDREDGSVRSFNSEIKMINN